MAQSVWYQAKALELAAELFFIAQSDQELFCHRQQRLSVERVEKVIALLRERLARPAESRGNRSGGGLQSILFEPNLFGGHGNDHPAIRATTSDGARGGVAPVRQVQCHRSGFGSGLFEPEPFQPGFSRHLRVLSGSLSVADADPEIFAEAKAVVFGLGTVVFVRASERFPKLRHAKCSVLPQMPSLP